MSICTCGRPRATEEDLARFVAAVPVGNPYTWSPSTWQLVRLGVCLPPDSAHLDIPAELLDVCWSLIDRCRCPPVREPR